MPFRLSSPFTASGPVSASGTPIRTGSWAGMEHGAIIPHNSTRLARTRRKLIVDLPPVRTPFARGSNARLHFLHVQQDAARRTDGFHEDEARALSPPRKRNPGSGLSQGPFPPDDDARELLIGRAEGVLTDPAAKQAAPAGLDLLDGFCEPADRWTV